MFLILAHKKMFISLCINYQL